MCDSGELVGVRLLCLALSVNIGICAVLRSSGHAKTPPSPAPVWGGQSELCWLAGLSQTRMILYLPHARMPLLLVQGAALQAFILWSLVCVTASLQQVHDLFV